VLFRTVLKREIEKVQQGLDPMGVVRDPSAAPVDTSVQAYIDMVRRGLYRTPVTDPGGIRLFADGDLAGVP